MTVPMCDQISMVCILY